MSANNTPVQVTLTADEWQIVRDMLAANIADEADYCIDQQEDGYMTELDAIAWMEPMNEVMSKITAQTTTDLI